MIAPTRTIEINGKNYECKLTIEAIDAIEDACGCGLLAIAQEMQENQFRHSRVAHILHQGSRATKSGLTYTAIREAIASIDDFTAYAPIAYELVMTALAPESMTEQALEDAGGGKAQTVAETTA